MSSQTVQHRIAQRKFVLLHMLFILPPPQRHVFAPILTGTVCIRPLASSLPVSNSDQSVGKELARKRRKTHVKKLPTGVSVQPDYGFSNPSISAADHKLVREFSSYFEHLSPWETALHHWSVSLIKLIPLASVNFAVFDGT